MQCYCDYEPATVYRASRQIARKQHKCAECARMIQPGERYESVFAIWDGDVGTPKTCQHCLALRDYVVAHVPCSCWSHHNMREDVLGDAEAYAHEAPGLLFGALRREVAIQRAARVAAFLTVPLYAKVYEQFKGSPLPPQAGLERAIEAMGVGGKVKDKARQVMLRSAKQAGFLDAAPDRLVKPASRQESAVDKPTGNAEGGNDSATGRAGGPAGGEGGGRDHPLIQGLLMTLPAPGSEWSADERVNWLTMASSIFTMIYKGGQAKIQISMTTTKTGDTTSAG